MPLAHGSLWPGRLGRSHMKQTSQVSKWIRQAEKNQMTEEIQPFCFWVPKDINFSEVKAIQSWWLSHPSKDLPISHSSHFWSFQWVIPKSPWNSILNCLVVDLPLWKIWVRQWEGLSHILWTIKNVPNHQPVRWSKMVYIMISMIWDTHILGNKTTCFGQKQPKFFRQTMAETIAQLRIWSNRCSLDLGPSGSWISLLDDSSHDKLDMGRCFHN